jgi:hypothetical protein
LKVGDAVDRYVDAAGSRGAGGYALSAEELVWLLTSGQERGGDDLELLKALQRALPQPEDEADAIGELKAVLTNAIIMRTRLAEREADLPDLLGRVIEEGRLDALPADEDIVRRIAALMVEGAERIRHAAKDPTADPGATS